MEKIRGRDLAAPIRRMTLDGETYTLKFNNRAARIAEDVYADIYGLPDKCGYMSILGEAAAGRHRAFQAIYYGALIAGGAVMDWERYDEVFRLDAIEGVREIILQSLSDSLPPADPNAVSQPRTPSGPGAG